MSYRSTTYTKYGWRKVIEGMGAVYRDQIYLNFKDVHLGTLSICYRALEGNVSKGIRFSMVLNLEEFTFRGAVNCF